MLKAVTGKYKPVHSWYCLDTEEVLPDLPKDVQDWPEAVAAMASVKGRLAALGKVVGASLL